MISRPAQTPCLGERVSTVADGSARADVRDRALAHTLTCPSCRDALDVERLTIERLRSLPQPTPSARLMAALYALGEPGDPVPPRTGYGPGMPRPTPVAVGPVPAGRTALSVPPALTWSGSVRPGGSRRPGGTRERRGRVLVAAAGALGVGVVAAGVITAAGTGASVVPSGRTPVAQLTVQPASRQSGSGTSGASAGSRSSSRGGSASQVAGLSGSDAVYRVGGQPASFAPHLPAAGPGTSWSPSPVPAGVAAQPAVAALFGR